MNIMTHSLTFRRAVPGSEADEEGYVVRWRGVALMGILNVTPDSFSDGGSFISFDAACRQARTMLQEGALVLDVGGESTRPGSEPVSVEEEIDRVRPVIHWLAQETNALISIDTSKPEVARAALDAGAQMVNDVTGLQDPEMVQVCAQAGVPAVIMHMQGEPRTMQHDPHYDDVVAEVAAFLARQAEHARQAGVPGVMIDPGIGFGKTLKHNLTLLNNVRHLATLGFPVLVGASRKALIGRLVHEPVAARRDPGSVALHLHATTQGVAMVRVHAVGAHHQALRVWEALHG
jgi:dihydropteroate synthase